MLSVLACSVVMLICIGLVYKSAPVLDHSSLFDLLTGDKFKPLKGHFGMLPFIASTIWVTGLALLLAVPAGLLCSIYLAEYAHRRVLTYISPVLDILSGIPSVIFGVWGVIVIVPLVRTVIAPAFGISTTGYSVLAGGIVLAVMILPLIINVLIEVFRAIPVELREAALSLGATRWEMVSRVLLRKARPGIIAAIILGLSRAFGETLAVLMVVGNVVNIPASPLEPGYPLPALIANNYGEMLSIPLYDSALMFSALILFLIVVMFNGASRYILVRIERKWNP